MKPRTASHHSMSRIICSFHFSGKCFYAFKRFTKPLLVNYSPKWFVQHCIFNLDHKGLMVKLLLQTGWS